MKKNLTIIICISVLMILLCKDALCIKIMNLQEVEKPSTFCINNNYIYIADMDEIYAYSLKERKLAHKFGKKGEGPGEYISTMEYPARVYATDKTVLVESVNKVIIYSIKGDFIREIKKSITVNNVLPAGRNFVARIINQGVMDVVSKSTVALFDSDLKLIKKLCTQDYIQQDRGGKRILDLGQDFLIYKVSKDRIFVDQSKEGFIVRAYDFEGNLRDTLTFKDKKIPVDSEWKSILEKNLEMDPHIQEQLRRGNIAWNALKKHLTLEYPDFLPQISDFYVSDTKLLLVTPWKKDSKSACILSDFNGKNIRRIMMTEFEKPSLLSRLMGISLSDFYKNKILYIVENEDEEIWELHEQRVI